MMRRIARGLGVGLDHVTEVFGRDDESELYPPD